MHGQEFLLAESFGSIICLLCWLSRRIHVGDNLSNAATAVWYILSPLHNYTYLQILMDMFVQLFVENKICFQDLSFVVAGTWNRVVMEIHRSCSSLTVVDNHPCKILQPVFWVNKNKELLRPRSPAHCEFHKVLLFPVQSIEVAKFCRASGTNIIPLKLRSQYKIHTKFWVHILITLKWSMHIFKKPYPLATRCEMRHGKPSS